MLRAFYSSATGMRAQELLIDNTANNIANVNTTGYKRSQLDFADLMYTTVRAAGADTGGGVVTPTGLQIGSGVRPVGTTKVFSNGVVEETQRNTDLAIQGDGFFQVDLPNGQQVYTRDGSFRRGPDGQMMTGDGHILSAGISIPPEIPDSEISISKDGTVNAGALGPQGNIPLFRFPNPAGLDSLGGNLLGETLASGAAIEGTPGLDGTGQMLAGYLERSNVEVVKELVSLITAQRAYEFNSRAIRAGDEMLSTTAQIVR